MKVSHNGLFLPGWSTFPIANIFYSFAINEKYQNLSKTKVSSRYCGLHCCFLDGCSVSWNSITSPTNKDHISETIFVFMRIYSSVAFVFPTKLSIGFNNL